MAPTAPAPQHTPEGKTFSPIWSERHWLLSPPPHRLKTARGEVRWPDSQLSPFPGDGPCYRFDGSEFLDSISAAATRGRRRPRAGAWATSRLPGVLGRLVPGQARLNDRECGEGETHPEKRYRQTSGAAPSLSPRPTGDPARPPRAPASSVRTSVLPSFLCRCLDYHSNPIADPG
jgi:hypothetical protein